MISAVLPNQTQQRAVFQTRNEKPLLRLTNPCIEHKDTFTPSFKGDFNLPLDEVKSIGAKYLAEIKKTFTDKELIERFTQGLNPLREKIDLFLDYSGELNNKLTETANKEVNPEINKKSLVSAERLRDDDIWGCLNHEINGSFMSSHYLEMDDASDKALDTIGEKGIYNALKTVKYSLKTIEDNSTKIVKHNTKAFELYQFFLDYKVNKKPIGAARIIAKTKSFAKDMLQEKNIKLIIKDKDIINKYGNSTFNDMSNFVMVSNAFNNAIKYSPNDSKVIIGAKVKNNRLYLTIQDKGIGIPRKAQDSMFKDIVRGDNVENIPGTGFGMFKIGAILKKAGLELPTIISPLDHSAKKYKGTFIELPLISKIDVVE